MGSMSLGGAVLLLLSSVFLTLCMGSTPGVRSLLEDDVEMPVEIKAKDSPMGVINAGRFLSHPDVANMTASSPKAMKAWRKAVKAAGKAAIKDLEVEIVSDDDTSFRSDQKHGFDRKAEERKELDDVITKAQGLAVPSDDRIKEGADTEAIYKNAEAQATASAYMAAGESAVADSYVYSLGALGKIPNAKPWARQQDGASVARKAVEGPLKAAAAGKRAGKGAPAGVTTRSKLGSGIEQFLSLIFGQQGQAEQLGEAQTMSSQSLAGIGGGAGSGLSGTGYTGVDDGPVWHAAAPSVWHAAASVAAAAAVFDPSLYPPGYKHAFDDNAGAAGPPGTSDVPDASAAAAAGGGAAAAAAASVWVSAPQKSAGGLTGTEQLLPPGSGLRGPPEDKPSKELDDAISGGIAAGGLAMAIGQSEQQQGCSVREVSVCRDTCTSKANLDMGAGPLHKCMPKCLGPCAAAFGYVASSEAAAQAIAKIQNADAKLIQKVEDEVVSAATGAKKSASLSAADKRQADQIAAGALARIEGRGGKTTQQMLQPEAAGALGASTGARLLPADVVMPPGTPTGVYDCRGAAILVGSVVGRMVGGQSCEDRFLLVTAGKWQVSSFGPPGTGGGDGFTDDRTAKAGRDAVLVDLVMKGITSDVNMGTRLDFEPVKGAFTDWKIVEGATNDLFLPANVNRMVTTGSANQARSPDSVQKSAAVLSHAHMDRPARSDKLEQAMMKDWDTTHAAEKSSRWQYYPNNPEIKYVVGAIILLAVGAWQLVSRGGVLGGSVQGGLNWARESARHEYVSLPDVFGARGGKGAEMEMQEKGPGPPCLSDNAPDRVILVHIGGEGGKPSKPSAGPSVESSGGYQ